MIDFRNVMKTAFRIKAPVRSGRADEEFDTEKAQALVRIIIVTGTIKLHSASDINGSDTGRGMERRASSQLLFSVFSCGILVDSTLARRKQSAPRHYHYP
ncbi:hypothetical protein [Agrobacterium vitis]|uniref:hypothetical protein n=1 Tax=Agrobacterium vitis TaxID=373 RepID=UPI001F1A9AF3|nr:hypothetical protein [Agrobacterium vitis]